MRAVGAGSLGETLRIHRTEPIVAFGRRDTVAPGYAEALEASSERGFLPIERLAGGRAAVFHRGTIAFSWAIPATDPRVDIQGRFREISAIWTSALTALGVDARVGEVPGEYCPGAFSVNAGGRTKIMGVGQRLVSGAAHIGGVVVVDDRDSIRGVLIPVYRALGIEWKPDTVGSVAAEIGSVTLETVEWAVRNEFERRYRLQPSSLPASIVDHGRQLARTHLAPDDGWQARRPPVT